MIRFAIIEFLAFLFFASNALAQSCVANPVTVQILGSGGPAINRDRASTSYLLWIDDSAKILVDIGGGAFLRLSEEHVTNPRALCFGVGYPHSPRL